MSEKQIELAASTFDEVTKPTFIGENFAYIRVSSVEQNDERQRKAITERLEREGKQIDQWFAEKVSAKDDNRPQLQTLLNLVRRGDVIYVHDLSRVARNTEDLLHIVKMLNDKGVRLVSNKEDIDTTKPIGKFLLTILGAVYELERTMMLERQSEGIAIAKEQDEGKAWKDKKYKGRIPFERTKKFDKNKFEKYYVWYLNREISKTEFARQIGTSRPTVDRLIEKRRAEGDAFPVLK